ncbi:hypothetical protein ACVWWR_000495 [Bradyrhizobium sp. LM3.2]
MKSAAAKFNSVSEYGIRQLVDAFYTKDFASIPNSLPFLRTPSPVTGNRI